MDHLPQLVSQEYMIPETPFYTQYSYDNRGIRGFSARSHYTFGSWHQNPDSDSAFLQAWLYFGTLTEVFGTYNIQVNHWDFCKADCGGRLNLSTQYLQDYIAAWTVKASREHGAILEKDKIHSTVNYIAGEIIARPGIVTKQMNVGQTPSPHQIQRRSNSPEGQEVTQSRAARIHQILRDVAAALNDLLLSAGMIQDTVWDSVLILCSTLQTAAYYLYRSYNFPFKFIKLFDKLSARQLDGLFNRNNWCVREQKIVRDMSEGDNCVLFMAAQLNRGTDYMDHSRCDVALCQAYQVKESNYQTLHVRSDCYCDFIGFGKSEGGFLSPISRAVIQPPSTLLNVPTSPMVMYENGHLRLVEVKLIGGDARRFKLPFGQAFAAISHVWGHGLGNPNSNDLPRCQVERIQDLVNGLFTEERKPVPFWLDTLCIPVDRDSRKEALVRMEGIYKSATKILVLDKTLYQLSTSNMSSEEIGLRIMCSPWARRLWTLSDGSFQSRVVYRFKDSFYRYRDLNSTIRIRHAFPNRRCAIPVNHFLNTILMHPPNCEQPLGPLWKHGHKALSCAWPRISTFFKEMSITYQPADLNWHPGTQLNPWIQITVPRAIRTVMSRTTSRLSDECRVFASLTHWWSGSVKMFKDLDPAEHYRRYFQNFGCVPTQLIFLNQERYEEDGSRWIPRSLLSQVSPNCDPMDFEHKTMDDEFGWHTSKGLEVEYPGLRLSWDRRFYATFPQFFHVRLFGSLYEASVHKPGTTKCPKPLPSGENIAIVLPRNISQTPRKCSGVLVTIHDGFTSPPTNSAVSDGRGFGNMIHETIGNIVTDYRDRDRIFARHEALVQLSLFTGQNSSEWSQGHVQAFIINGCRSKRDTNNNRWRLG